MISLELYLAYLLACFVIVIVPGPTVTLVVANSLKHGARAGLLNVAGTALGVALMIAIVAIGLASLVEAMGHWFDLIRLIGAAYLIWLGVRMFRAPVGEDGTPVAPEPRGGFFLQGFMVALSNPKALIFFGAFLPQFIDPRGDPALQVAVLGTSMLIIGALSDSFYAVLAGRAGRALSRHRVKLISQFSGACLVGGGVWLALQRSR